jgi:SIR2-like protein
METAHWEILLDRIREQKCTPFLGAGASSGTLPLGGQIAADWARDHDYPLEDMHDLARVAQFLAVKLDAMAPKEMIRRVITAAGVPDAESPDEPHAVLAKLPLPLYLTTNFDGFMTMALRSAGKEPQQELSRWNERLLTRPSILDSPEGYRPTVKAPLVCHLHGHLDVVESLVLTEDDYFDFLVNLPQVGIPPLIQEALSATSLLFVGYRLADWNFRVLFRGFVELTQPSDRRLSVTVQLPPSQSPEMRERAMQYLSRYFDKKEIVVYWGSAEEFMAELGRRWLESGAS